MFKCVLFNNKGPDQSCTQAGLRLCCSQILKTGFFASKAITGHAYILFELSVQNVNNKGNDQDTQAGL